MVTQEFAQQFAEHWIEAWNSHDLAQVLLHYAEEFEMSSPYIIQMTNQTSGTLKGRAAISSYWAKALERIPTLRFELVELLIGVNSIVLYYRSARGMAAETFFFNAHGKVIRACAHYA